MSEEPLAFFEVVRIRSVSGRKKEAWGKTGYIAGWAFEEQGDPIEGYGVWIYDLEEVWSCDLDEVEPLGYRDEIAEAEHRNMPSIRVSPDGTLL